MTSDPQALGFQAVDDIPDLALAGTVRVPDDVWAIGPRHSVAGGVDLSVRIGFAGERAHAGHIGLARSAAELSKRGATLLLYDFGRRADSTLGVDFRRCLGFFLGQAHTTVRRVDVAAARDSALQLLGRAKLGSVLRTYGWDEQVPVSRLGDMLDMVGFLTFPPRLEADFAYADRNQVTHLSLLRRWGDLGESSPSTMMLRRLLPHLIRPGMRATSRDASSVIFLTDGASTVTRKIGRGRTAGGGTEREHRVSGGSPSRCPVYLQFSAICGASEAAETRAACQNGTLSCGNCKCNVASLVAHRLERLRTHQPVPTSTDPKEEGPRNAPPGDSDPRP